ncbi:cupredoxin domain-containing protein [Sedimenticola sp.]|uniref:cupredoxin domain-containing protein n=1 Tax=Sedimenticola sp. TaxID=1940285 RepID=UPI003D134563
MPSAKCTLRQIRNSLIVVSLLTLSLPCQAGGNAQAEVEIFKFQFTPQEITVKPGTTIRWTNKEKRQYHSVWFEQAGDPEAAYFFPGETYERTFDIPGVYPYHCGPHPKMTGIVRVE